jgi:hypothetical protein
LIQPKNAFAVSLHRSPYRGCGFQVALRAAHFFEVFNPLFVAAGMASSATSTATSLRSNALVCLRSSLAALPVTSSRIPERLMRRRSRRELAGMTLARDGRIKSGHDGPEKQSPGAHHLKGAASGASMINWR